MAKIDDPLKALSDRLSALEVHKDHPDDKRTPAEVLADEAVVKRVLGGRESEQSDYEPDKSGSPNWWAQNLARAELVSDDGKQAEIDRKRTTNC